MRAWWGAFCGGRSGWVCLAVFCLVLSACTMRSVPPDDTADLTLSQEHYNGLAAIKSWRMHGKVAVKQDDQVWQLGLRWRHSEAEDVVQLFDLMGRQLLDARGNQRFMDIRDNRGRHYRNVPTADFIADLIGRPIRPASLSSWVMGQAWSQATVEVIAVDERGRIVRMQQSGWTIHYSDYQQQLHGVAMPGRVVCELGDFQLTILSHEWQLCLHDSECYSV